MAKQQASDTGAVMVSVRIPAALKRSAKALAELAGESFTDMVVRSLAKEMQVMAANLSGESKGEGTDEEDPVDLARILAHPALRTH